LSNCRGKVAKVAKVANFDGIGSLADLSIVYRFGIVLSSEWACD